MSKHVSIDTSLQLYFMICILFILSSAFVGIYILNCVYILYNFSRHSERCSAKPLLENDELDLH